MLSAYILSRNNAVLVAVLAFGLLCLARQQKELAKGGRIAGWILGGHHVRLDSCLDAPVDVHSPATFDNDIAGVSEWYEPQLDVNDFMRESLLFGISESFADPLAQSRVDSLLSCVCHQSPRHYRRPQYRSPQQHFQPTTSTLEDTSAVLRPDTTSRRLLVSVRETFPGIPTANLGQSVCGDL